MSELSGMKKILLAIFFTFYFSFFTFHFLSAQTDTTIRTRISLLTCAPGGELYATFGHTALRIIDSIHQTDMVFNYGTFDFDDPHFYTKFVRGKLEYFLSFEPIQNFLYGYQLENRSVWEQELLLTNQEKRNIVQAIQTNLTGNNRYYKYDFLNDNCTSRVKDMLTQYAGLNVAHPLVKEGTTYRGMLHRYLDAAHMPWSKLGIDILLGSPSDKKVTIEESMFLPDYLMKAVDSSIHTSKPILQQKNTLFTAQDVILSDNRYQPLVVFSLVWFCTAILYSSKKKLAKKITPFIHSLFLYISGFMGIVLLFMWLGTDHKAFGPNYNLAWALPTNAIAAFFVWRKPIWLKKYCRFTSWVYLLLLACWFILPQQFNIALFAFTVTLLTTNVSIVRSSI
jgi:hypothetical protein